MFFIIFSRFWNSYENIVIISIVVVDYSCLNCWTNSTSNAFVSIVLKKYDNTIQQSNITCFELCSRIKNLFRNTIYEDYTLSISKYCNNRNLFGAPDFLELNGDVLNIVHFIKLWVHVSEVMVKEVNVEISSVRIWFKLTPIIVDPIKKILLFVCFSDNIVLGTHLSDTHLSLTSHHQQFHSRKCAAFMEKSYEVHLAWIS